MKEEKIVEVPEQELPEEGIPSQEAQNASALYGIASVIVSTGKAPHKQRLKVIIKQTRKFVLKEAGEEGGWDMMRGNKKTIEDYLWGVKNDVRLDGMQRKKVYQAAIDDLEESCLKGEKEVLGIGKQKH